MRSRGQHLVAVGDAARVLLRAPVEAGHEDLVAGVERVGLGEQRREVVEHRVGGAAQLVGVAVEVGGQRASGVPAARQPVVVPGDGVPGPGADDEQGDRDRRRGRERPVPVPVGRRPAVAEDGPGRVGRHRQGQRPLEVVLVEAREDPVRDVHPAVRRHVGLAVGRVGEGVHAVAVGDVGQAGLDGHLGHHAGREAGQRDPPGVVRRLDRRAVDGDADRVGVGELQEGGRRSRREPHGAPRAEGAGGGVGEVEVDVVGRRRHLVDARPGLGEGERPGRHAGDPTTAVTRCSRDGCGRLTLEWWLTPRLRPEVEMVR